MNSLNNTIEDVHENEDTTDNFLIWTSILTFVFTLIYTIFRITILKPDIETNDSINDIIIDISTCSPLSAIISATIGVTMIFGSVRLFKKKVVAELESQGNEIKKLRQLVTDSLKKENLSDTNQKPNIDKSDYEEYPIKPKPDHTHDIKPENKSKKV